MLQGINLLRLVYVCFSRKDCKAVRVKNNENITSRFMFNKLFITYLCSLSVIHLKPGRGNVGRREIGRGEIGRVR